MVQCWEGGGMEGRGNAAGASNGSPRGLGQAEQWHAMGRGVGRGQVGRGIQQHGRSVPGGGGCRIEGGGGQWYRCVLGGGGCVHAGIAMQLSQAWHTGHAHKLSVGGGNAGIACMPGWWGWGMVMCR